MQWRDQGDISTAGIRTSLSAGQMYLGYSDLQNEAKRLGHFTVATQYTTRTRFYRSDTGIMGSTPTRHVYVDTFSCVRLCRKRPCRGSIRRQKKSYCRCANMI
jgi:hypothetical protein